LRHDAEHLFTGNNYFDVAKINEMMTVFTGNPRFNYAARLYGKRQWAAPCRAARKAA